MSRPVSPPPPLPFGDGLGHARQSPIPPVHHRDGSRTRTLSATTVVSCPAIANPARGLIPGTVLGPEYRFASGLLPLPLPLAHRLPPVVPPQTSAMRPMERLTAPVPMPVPAPLRSRPRRLRSPQLAATTTAFKRPPLPDIQTPHARSYSHDNGSQCRDNGSQQPQQRWGSTTAHEC
jgi:hypothetical protein